MSAIQPETAHTLLARHASNTTPAARPHVTASRRLVLWPSGILALPIAICVSLAIYSQFASDLTFAHVLGILCAVLLLLSIPYFIFTSSENARLVSEQEQQHIQAELLQKATASFNSILDMDVLLDHIVTASASELCFDAAALVFVEEYEHAAQAETSLVIRAALPHAHQVAAWHINGNMLPSCASVLGHEREVLWPQEAAYPLRVVYQWHAEQRMHTSLFVPLSYLGKIQGCLAFSSRAKRRMTAYERSLARAFAEKAAHAIEYAHLSQQARENTLFSQTMSNVAAKLNSVVTSGTQQESDIHHMICVEGVNTLRANLAILYVHHTDGQFIAHAAATNFSEPPTSSEEWPAISQTLYTSLLLNAQQPYLLRVEQPWQSQTDYSSAITLPLAQENQMLSVIQRGSALPTRAPQPRGAQLPLKYNHGVPSYPQRSLTLPEALQHRGAHAALLVPIKIHQKPMGLLVLARMQRPGPSPKRAFTSQEFAHAQDFAGQAAIACTNAHLYQQLRNAHRRMQELDQLKDQFIMTASHELRTPLTAVQGYIELLEHYQGTISPVQFQEFLQKASRGCDELVLLLNNVMDASRLEIEAGIRPTNFERIVVREVIEHVIDLIGLRVAQQHRSIQVHIPSHLVVQADATYLRQVLLNLSVNALKYSPPSTPLIFSARSFFTPNSSVIISVTDRGKGIKPQDQGKLFQRFMRLESDLNSTVRGSGLGLYISRRLVQSMHGKIWIESTGVPGEGTSFHIQLVRA